MYKKRRCGRNKGSRKASFAGCEYKVADGQEHSFNSLLGVTSIRSPMHSPTPPIQKYSDGGLDYPHETRSGSIH